LLVSSPDSPVRVENIIGLVTFAFVTAIYTAEIKHKSLQNERSKLHKRATGEMGGDWLGLADLCISGKETKYNCMCLTIGVYRSEGDFEIELSYFVSYNICSYF